MGYIPKKQLEAKQMNENMNFEHGKNKKRNNKKQSKQNFKNYL
jgi:hypothetical protein